MSTFDDDVNEMNFGNESDALVGAAAASGEAAVVTQFLTDLRTLGQGPVPTPSAELAAVIGAAESLVARRRHRALGLVVRRLALTAAAVLVAMTALAANHSLPAPAQRVVSNVVNTITPFHIDPARVDDRPPKPTQFPVPHSTVPSHPVPHSTAPSHPAPRSPEQTRDDTGSRSEDTGSNGEDPAPASDDGGASAAGGDDGGTRSSTSSTHPTRHNDSEGHDRGDGHDD
ncbi:MAG: hypothetical protein ABI429_08540 [Jatrophihabitantaceae bacterium]